MSKERSGFKRGVVTILALIGGITIIAVVLGFFIFMFTVVTKDRVPARTILELNLERGMVEYVPDDPVASVLLSDLLIVRDIVDALERAKDDDRVVGLVARIGTGEIAAGHIQEIRDAIISFRESGKPAIAFSETFGEFGPGFAHYYLATAFDSVFLQPSGDLGLIGFSVANPFFKRLLDKLDITPQLDHRYEYKTAMNLFTEERYTEPHREASERVMNSIYRQFVRAIGESRNLDEYEVQRLIEAGPYTAGEALDLGLVDGLAYRDEVYEQLRNTVGGNAQFLYLERYLERAKRPHRRGETIALIYGTGTVVRGKSGFDPVFFSTSMGSETVTRAFRDAIDDKNTRAIIFRIDSPGGSYVASDAIWREVVRAREQGIPVIASMSSVAGSGGYFVAMAADKIVAQPATITGSIGVVGGKMVLRDLYERLGITWDILQTTESATTWSPLERFTPQQWERVQHWLDRVYEDFTQKAADGRGMSQEEIHKIARGRIWTGEDALELGLIDALGGFNTAIELAREAAGIDPKKDIRIRLYPPRRTLLDMLLNDRQESSEPASIIAYKRVMETLRPVIQLLGEAEFRSANETLKLPHLSIDF